jgi:Rps23 Pro-64 3,4-dihydroxylase Tpa1-like proline 4-hydroxylase
MSKNSAIDHLYLGNEKIRIDVAIDELRAKYRSASPFPHIVIDDVFPASILDKIKPELADQEDRRHWTFENSESLVRYNLRSATELGEAGFRLTSFLHSAPFLYFLTELTGISKLLPDPYLQGAGYNTMPRSGYFRIHGDRNTAYETGLTRRLAVIIYLNKNWPREYGGQLELWNSGGTDCEVSVDPIFNRTIIFDTSEGHLHGVPPVCCPEDRSRDSFLAYFHTASNSGDTGAVSHGTIYAPSYYGAPKMTTQAIVKDWVPPVLYRTAKKLFRRRKQ